METNCTNKEKQMLNIRATYHTKVLKAEDDTSPARWTDTEPEEVTLIQISSHYVTFSDLSGKLRTGNLKDFTLHGKGWLISEKGVPYCENCGNAPAEGSYKEQILCRYCLSDGGVW